MVSFLRKIVAPALLFLVGASVWAQETGRIQGRISDAEHVLEPLPFAEVVLKELHTTVRTNLHGNFEFSELPEGDYTLTVRSLGYREEEFPVYVQPGETTRIDGKINVLSAKPLPVEKTK